MYERTQLLLEEGEPHFHEDDLQFPAPSSEMVVPTTAEMDQELDDFFRLLDSSSTLLIESKVGLEDEDEGGGGVPHKPPIPGETAIKYRQT